MQKNYVLSIKIQCVKRYRSLWFVQNKLSWLTYNALRPKSLTFKMSAADSTVAMSGRKLRILALHGYRQNAEAFKAKIGSFRKTVAKYAELIFLSAPHLVRNTDPDSEQQEGEQRGWWFNAEDYTFSGTRVGGPAIGFTDTLQLLEKTFKDYGPFDGILGFSQGACLVGILAAMQQKGLLPYKFQFVIMAAGFCSGSLVHKSFYDEEISFPSLHIYGETDKIIPKEMSEALISLFSNPRVVDHEGGHYLACSGSMKDHYKDFLKDIKNEEFEYYEQVQNMETDSS